MGNCLISLGFKRLKRPVTLLLVGLDNAGKTTTVRGIVGGSITNVVPTVGFSPLKLTYRGCDVTIFDLGGGARIRGVWTSYYAEVHGVIFVIDSSDAERTEECKQVLQSLLSHQQISGKPFLILANKQDVPNALDEIDIVEQLNIEQIVNKYKCPTRVETCSAITLVKNKPEKEVADGFRWLIDTIVLHYDELHQRVTKDLEKEKEKRLKDIEERRERVRLFKRNEEIKDKITVTPDTTLSPDDSLDEIVVVHQTSQDVPLPMKRELERATRRIFVDTIIEENESRSNRSSVSVADAEELDELGFQSSKSEESTCSSIQSMEKSSHQSNPDESSEVFAIPHENQEVHEHSSPIAPVYHVTGNVNTLNINTETDSSITSIIKENLELEATKSQKARRPLLKRLNKTAPMVLNEMMS